jgi:hypothetical protein
MKAAKTYDIQFWLPEGQRTAAVDISRRMPREPNIAKRERDQSISIRTSKSERENGRIGAFVTEFLIDFVSAKEALRAAGAILMVGVFFDIARVWTVGLSFDPSDAQLMGSFGLGIDVTVYPCGEGVE